MKKWVLALGIMSLFGTMGQTQAQSPLVAPPSTAQNCPTAETEYQACAGPCVERAGCVVSTHCNDHITAYNKYCENNTSNSSTSSSSSTSGGSTAGGLSTGVATGSNTIRLDLTNPVSGINNVLDRANIFSGGIIEGVGTVGEVRGNFEDAWRCIEGGFDCKITPEGSFELPDPELFNTIGENVSLRQYILNVLNFVLSFLGLIAVAAIVYAGFLYVTSGGDDSANEKAKKIVIYAVIGILLILAAFAIVNTIIRNAGVGGDDRDPNANIETPVLPPQGGGNGNILVPPTGGGGGGIDLRNQLYNPIIIEGNNVQDGGNSAFVSLEDAKQGNISFGIAVEAVSILDFGDGTQLNVNTEVNPTARIPYSYGKAGTYNVRALIQTADGQLSAFSKKLVVGGLQTQINGPFGDSLVNRLIGFNARGTQSSVGTIVSYNWTCSGCTFTDSAAEETQATFAAAGDYEVTLTVTNSLGQTATKTIPISIVGDKPVANFEGASTRDNNRAGEFRFDASDSLNLEGGYDGLTYNWTLDGNSRRTNSPQITYLFTKPGPVEVELFVSQVFKGEELRSETVSQTFEVPSTLDVDFDVY